MTQFQLSNCIEAGTYIDAPTVSCAYSGTIWVMLAIHINLVGKLSRCEVARKMRASSGENTIFTTGSCMRMDSGQNNCDVMYRFMRKFEYENSVSQNDSALFHKKLSYQTRG